MGSGISKTQAIQNLRIPIYGMPGFSGMEVPIQIYEPETAP